MTTKKTTSRKSTPKAAKTQALRPKDIIEKYDVLKFHVKILTVLSVGIFVLTVILAITLFNCDICVVRSKSEPKPVATVQEGEIDEAGNIDEAEE